MLRSSNRAARGQRMSLPISKLKTEPDTFQFRAFECDEDHVRCLSNALGVQRFFDPMKVWRRGEDDFVVLDGHHRYAAYKACEVKAPVPVVVYECDEAEACLLALRENSMLIVTEN